LSTAFVRRVQR